MTDNENKEYIDLYKDLKDTARQGATFSWPLRRPELRMQLKEEDAISIEIIEYLVERYPDIKQGQLVEQMQNAIVWMHMFDIMGQHQRDKIPEPDSDSEVRNFPYNSPFLFSSPNASINSRKRVTGHLR
jgi:hypothetical protein